LSDDETKRKQREKMRKWRAKNPERDRETSRRNAIKWGHENIEKTRGHVRKWHSENPGKARECNRVEVAKWRQRNLEKYRAHWMLRNAIKKGIVTRPDTCACGKGPVEGHHADYSQPLMVKWLCRECHNIIHREERWMARKKD
jgi:hypothetical protein